MLNKILLYTFGPMAILAALVAYVDNRGYHHGYDAAQKLCAETTVPAARLEEQQVCVKNTTLTKESNDELQKSKKLVDAQLADAKRRLRKAANAKCTPLTSEANVGESANGQPLPNGVSSEWLLEQAANHDDDAVTLNSCIEFVDKVWATQP